MYDYILKKRKKHTKTLKNKYKTYFGGNILQILLLLLASCFSGIFAGMGMGGGTFLIPILSLFFGVEQIICQSTNVICFVFLAIICSVVYIKNKLIDYKVAFCILIPASIIASLASIFALKIESKILQICFSCFIILVGVFYFIRTVKNIKNKSE